MSSPNAPSNPPAPELLDSRAGVLVRIVLLLAYPVLAHVASLREDGRWSALALASLVLLTLLGPLVRLRPWALLLLAGSGVGLYRLAASDYVWLLLLLLPVAFTLLIAWGFARTLLPGREPLITRIVSALHARAGMPMTEALTRYGRGLTLAWALFLAALTLFNLVLALCASPQWLAAIGSPPALAISHAQWSWLANLACWGLVGAFCVVEYAVRQRRFPQQPYRHVGDFVRQMAQLGPAFWRDLLR
ncbi:MAG TPA: ketosynthase [Stenotrophomonas sp.]|jgi:uncharacterized membrane protein